ncbi:hypothetical protein [Singulisphaera sp. PoT]|uniref:hypothetical protein n=1 Tax=Singulisphaera sp. PoT TaxID=3411797 RepID=UPI003BF4CA9F
MKIGVGSWTRVGLALLALATIPGSRAWSQAYPGPYVNLTAGGLTPLPPPPPKGAWGEVIMSNSKWLVVQNHEGQQFPISWESVSQYLVRWPTNAAALTNRSLIEAIGLDLGSNTVRTDHLDVYEGTDQTLVTATNKSVLPTNSVVTTIDPTFNRFMNAFDIAGQNTLYGWAYPIDPGTNGIPGQLYVVGNALGLDPLRVGTPGNNVATIVPDASGSFTMTQVTRGTQSFAEKGDIVFLTPVDLNPKSLVLNQLVVYKKIPRSRFVAE